MSAASPGPRVSRSSPFAEHVAAVGGRDGSLCALLDEQHGEAALPDRRERFEDDVDDRRREPERRLVEQQDVRLRDERARDRKLLLLAAGQRAGLPPAELPDDREELVHRRRMPRRRATCERRGRA